MGFWWPINPTFTFKANHPPCRELTRHQFKTVLYVSISKLKQTVTRERAEPSYSYLSLSRSLFSMWRLRTERSLFFTRNTSFSVQCFRGKLLVSPQCFTVSLSPHLNVSLGQIEGEEWALVDGHTTHPTSHPTPPHPTPSQVFSGWLWRDSWSWRLPAAGAGKPLGES